MRSVVGIYGDVSRELCSSYIQLFHKCTIIYFDAHSLLLHTSYELQFFDESCCHAAPKYAFSQLSISRIKISCVR